MESTISAAVVDVAEEEAAADVVVDLQPVTITALKTSQQNVID